MPKLIARFGPMVEEIFDPKTPEDKRRVFWNIILLTALVSGILALFVSISFAILLALSVLIAKLTWKNPKTIIVLLAVYIPLEPFLLKFVDDKFYVFARYAPEVLIYALAGTIFVKILTGKIKFKSTSIDLPFVFFAVTVVASLLINSVPVLYGILGLRQIIRFLILFFAVIQLDLDKEFAQKITAIMFVVVMLESALGIIQALTGGRIDAFLLPSEQRFYESVQLTSGTEQLWSPGSRVFATLGRYDQLGTFLSLFLLLVVGFLFYNNNAPKMKQRLYWILALGIPALILTLSRASWIGFLLGFFVLGAILLKNRRVRLGFLLAVSLLAVYVLISSAYVKYVISTPEQTAAERVLEVFSFERWRGEYYGQGRLFWIVQTPLVVVRSSPLFGVGPGQFGAGAAAALGNTAVYEKLNLPFGVYGTDGYIDNNWFALWGETGTLGLVFYVWMILAIAIATYEAWKQTQDNFLKGLAFGFFGAIIAVVFQGFLGTYFEVRTLMFYFWLYAALVYGLRQQEKLL